MFRYTESAKMSIQAIEPVLWYDDQIDTDDDSSTLVEYDITASPNDFNVTTIFNFVESGVVKIPGFQRNYVWDHKRASALIESLIIGLPIPQIFLYHEPAANKFLVIDGQQRLMSIYYFIKQRFPRDNARIYLRHIFQEHGKIPDDVFHDEKYFTNFRLRLPRKTVDQNNPLNGLNYGTLKDYKISFDLRTIRNVVIKQNSPDPEDDDSSIYEIFNRLNSGGVNLRAQEIRTSLYHSPFYEMLERANLLPSWRELIKLKEPDLHMKDIEFILRGFAMLMEGSHYKPSMTRFLNKFSKHCKSLDSNHVNYLFMLFQSFLGVAASLGPRSFINPNNNRFNISMFDAVFTAICSKAVQNRSLDLPSIDPDRLKQLLGDPEFTKASQLGTANTDAVETRLRKANDYLLG